MDYQTKLKQHLMCYRREELGIAEPGVFRYRGRNVPCEHILPVDQWHRNLLPLALELTESLLSNQGHDKGVKRHLYFHHLNSSQAFAFNLFLPYFGGGPVAAAALLRALGQDGELGTYQLEAVPDKTEGSNLDAVWRTVTGVETVCEVKLSEMEFGTAIDDERHRQKLIDIYIPGLKKHVDPAVLTPENFFCAYQVLRNVWHMVQEEQRNLIFLLPWANVRLWNSLQTLLKGVMPGTRSRIRAVAVEDVLLNLTADTACPTDLRQYAAHMIRKYDCNAERLVYRFE